MPDRAPLTLSVLGSLEAQRDGEPVRLSGRQERRVLAALIVHANTVVSTDRLRDLLWPDGEPRSAAHSIQTLVSRLRKALGDDRILGVKPGYRLVVEPIEVDRLRFEQLVGAGLAAPEPSDAAKPLGEALALWRGRPYDEFADEEFASAEVARLVELRLCAVEERCRAVVDLGRPAEVIGLLQQEIAAAPFRERLRAVLMLALARAGRPVEALRAFDAYRLLLADEVGVVPSAALRDLNDDIVRQHPGIGWDRSSQPGEPPAEMPSGTVTFLFTDVEGSTRLWQQHPDAMGVALARHDEIVRDAVESHRGSVVKTTGDGVHAVFSDATAAIDAAIAAQRSLRSQPWGDLELRVRMGLHAGAAEQRGRDYYGPAVNQAARLMVIAHGGQILCSHVVAELVEGHVELADQGTHQLRDVETAVRVFQVLAPGLETEFPPLATLDAQRSNLPREVSGFVGRVDDVIAVVKAFAEARVVSVVGAGGVGKTRLALRVGSQMLPAFADGVWWCELAGVSDPATIADAVAAAVGYVPSQGTSLAQGLPAFFRHKRLLLVLDNCEHLVGDVASFVDTITSDAPELSVLATSREALALPGERTYPVPPLELPLDTSPFEVEGSEAGALFATRAREARPSFLVTADNAVAIAELCVRLDANPLAIELAAARTVMMSPSEILARIEQRFQLLTLHDRGAPERHHTLEAAIEWSYGMLEPEEQALLQRCSVFVGDFDLDAVTAVARDAGLEEFDAVDRLGSLIAKSLVEVSQASTVTRYRLLETIRHFAAERLERAGATTSARYAHAAHHVGAGRAQFAMLHTARDFEALEQLRVDTPNLVAALRWLLVCDRVSDVLAFFADAGWIDSGLLSYPLLDELGRIADEAVVRDGADRCPGRLDALFFVGLRSARVGEVERCREVALVAGAADAQSPSVLQLVQAEAFFRADFASAASIGRRAVERARASGDRGCWASMLDLLYVAEAALGDDPAGAVAHAEEAVEVARKSPATSTLLSPLMMLSSALVHTDQDRALAAAEECIRRDRTHRRSWATLCAGTAATVRLERGELATGLALYREVLRHQHWSGEVFHIALGLPSLANSLARVDEALALDVTAIGGAIAPYAVFEGLAGYERLTAAVEHLGPDAVDTAIARAEAMSYDEAMEYVFDALDRLTTALAEGDEIATPSHRES